MKRSLPQQPLRWVTVLAVLFSLADGVSAASFESFEAAMHVYFERYGAIPIRLPEDEEPGDIYKDPYNGFVGRRQLCFSSYDPKIVGTILADAAFTKSSSLRGDVGASLYKAAKISAKANIQTFEEVTVKFSEATVAGLTENQVRTALESASTDCREAIRRIQEQGSEFTYVERVPWILRDVIHARITAIVGFRKDGSGSLNVNVKNDVLKQISDLGGGLSGDIESTGSIWMESEKPVAVAYRPAFISLEDVERLKSLDRRGFIEWLRKVLLGDGKARDQLAAIRSKFPDVSIPRPGKVSEFAAAGAYVPFDANNEEHAWYLSSLNLVAAASWEIFGE